MKKYISPKLLFGEKTAVRHADQQSLVGQIKMQFPGIVSYESLSKPEDFFAKSKAISFPNLTVVAMAISPSRVLRNGIQRLTIIIPLTGNNLTTLLSQSFSFGAGKHGMLLPEFEGDLLGEGTNRSHLVLNPTKEKLLLTAKSMDSQGDITLKDLQLDVPRAFSLQVGNQPVETILHHMGGIFDFYDCDSKVLEQLGYEDLLYRLIVCLLCPEIISRSTSSSDRRHSKPSKDAVLDQLCDLMIRRLSHKFTLPELAQISGYSERTLQYSFKDRYGCSPLEWLREQKLSIANHKIMRGEFSNTKSLAQECGLGSANQFTSLYKARFGITPNATRKERTQPPTQES